MKTITLTLFVILASISVNAQILGSFFSQKKENRKLLAQQIAALEVYKGILKSGYKIVSTGVSIINKIKTGDFNLHRDFFGALNSVNPKIKNYSKVAEILTLNIGAVNRLKNTERIAQSSLFPGWQNQYIKQVIEHSLEVLAQTIDELIAIISDKQISLKDDERIERIDKLYEKALELHSFTIYFKSEIAITKKNKEKRNADINGVKILNGMEKDE